MSHLKQYSGQEQELAEYITQTHFYPTIYFKTSMVIYIGQQCNHAQERSKTTYPLSHASKINT